MPTAHDTQGLDEDTEGGSIYAPRLRSLVAAPDSSEKTLAAGSATLRPRFNRIIRAVCFRSTPFSLACSSLSCPLSFPGPQDRQRPPSHREEGAASRGLCPFTQRPQGGYRGVRVGEASHPGPPNSQYAPPGRSVQLLISEFFRPAGPEGNSGQLYAPGGICEDSELAEQPPRGAPGESHIHHGCAVSVYAGDNECSAQSTVVKPRSAARAERRRAYRSWRSGRGEGDGDLDTRRSALLFNNHGGSWNASALTARAAIRLALTGQTGVLRSTPLWHRGRQVVAPSEVQGFAPPDGIQRIQKIQGIQTARPARSTVNRAALFRARVMNPIPDTPPVSAIKNSVSKLPYATPIKVAQWNVEDVRQVSLQHQVVQAMREGRWHLLFLSETHQPNSGSYKMGGMNTSSQVLGVSPRQRGLEWSSHQKYAPSSAVSSRTVTGS